MIDMCGQTLSRACGLRGIYPSAFSSKILRQPGGTESRLLLPAKAAVRGWTPAGLWMHPGMRQSDNNTLD